MGGNRIMGNIILLIAVVFILILTYYFLKATGNLDFIATGFKGFVQGTTP